MAQLAPLLGAFERMQLHTLTLEPCVHIVISDRVFDLEHLDQSRRASSEGWLVRESPLKEPTTLRAPELEQLQSVREALMWLEASLVRHGVPFRYASERELDSIVSTAPWTVVPTTRFVDEALAETLRYARRRGLPCSVGPFVPDGLFEATPRTSWPLALAESEAAVDEQVRLLVHDEQLPRRDVSPDTVRVLCHLRTDGAHATPAALFLLNPSRHDVDVSVACPGSSARDALTHAVIPSFAERLLVPLAKESIRLLELFPNEGADDDRY